MTLRGHQAAASCNVKRRHALPGARLVTATAMFVLTVAAAEPALEKATAFAAGQVDVVPGARPAPRIATPPNFKVAFIADTDDESGQRQVLELIAREGADLVLHQGDFSYSRGPTDDWANEIDEILGRDFPYLGSDGNHDNWRRYIPFFRDRLSRIGLDPDDLPDGSRGNYSTVYQGLKLVFAMEGGDADYIAEQLAGDEHIWKVCSWHKNRRATNVGPYGDEVEASSYKACFDAGAMVAQGHSHTYSRSETISDFDHLTVDTSCPQDPGTPQTDVCMSPGSSFFFDSSLGGHSSRRLENTDRDYWASYYSGEFGVLFIEFNVDGDPAKARGYFKTADGTVHDRFVITAVAAPVAGTRP
ncbi:MAG: metallophosphoesterase [Acidobacteria bacterium]|nr:metallophosphoesterase [Acidobacteriota bacterium]